MEQRGLKVISSDKTFFTKITNTISKLLIPTKVGFNGVIIGIKRNNVLKNYELYTNLKREEASDKKESISKKYEEAYTLYLEAIDKYIMDSVYKKVKNGTATEFEKNALATYYEVTHIKETEYLEYKHRKQQYLIELDYETIKELDKPKVREKFEPFYASKMETLYKGLLKHYSVKIADNLSFKDKSKIYDKIFETLEKYITDVLPIKMKHDEDNNYQEILNEYDKFSRFTVGKLDQKEYIEKKMILLGISRQLFTHSLPLIVAEQCYIKLLKDTRSLIVDTMVPQKRTAAYEMLIELIEDYNVRLLSTKIYWDKPQERDFYKKFWNQYKEIQKIKDENLELYQKKKEILFIKNDLKMLSNSKRDYSKIIKFYKTKLVNLGVMRQFKNTAKTLDGSYAKKNNIRKKEIV
ncbi:MAG TPA: hypothetical protein IAB70_07465 [Candidatus Merdicola faecigallinarum]|uniref:Uncharacterized protein n=1 Tax=Candidatus Merdicola faecigallinarum TaxID=2840862 RepID=A0A9D1M2F6_9FIRM|nr:hypothetical protein [Candidatus Merdicola faecigallinarum]